VGNVAWSSTPYSQLYVEETLSSQMGYGSQVPDQPVVTRTQLRSDEKVCECLVVRTRKL